MATARKTPVATRRKATPDAPTAKPRHAVVEKKPESPIPPSATELANAAKAEAAETIKVNVPHEFNFLDDDHVKHTFYPGVQQMRADFVEHWWIKQQGVRKV